MKCQELTENIIVLRERKNFFEFDTFLVEKMLGVDLLQYDVVEQESIRKNAYRTCIKKLGENQVAALQTIQKWFGIHGKSVPGREQIFELGFAMELSQEEVSEYLKKGIKEPDFQVNDYREVIFMYGLKHHMTYSQALDMIDEFEKGLSWDLEVSQHNHTNDLMGDYFVNCHMEKEEFLQWMHKYAGDFKGYSKTTLDYFKLLKKEILSEVKEDAGRQLECYLEQTGFYQWEKKRHLNPKKRFKTIPQYLFSKSGKDDRAVSGELIKTILELLDMTRISVDSNHELLAELYTDLNHQYRNFKTNNKKDLEKKRVPTDLNLIKDKYLSDLLNVGINKEKQIRLSILERKLRDLEAEKNCPEWALEVLKEYGCPEELKTNSQVLVWLEQAAKKQTRRCNLIKRKDILPLLLCTAQKRYQKRVNLGEEYCSEKAKEAFVELANMILSSCNMEPLNPEKYEFDAILFLCYVPEEGCSLSDVLEEIVRVG